MSFFQRLLRLPSRPRPAEVGSWLKGRKHSKNAMPVIDDICGYRDNWIDWWTASQPKWRSTGSWPFPMDDENNESWDDFPARGQNGIFLVIMAISWWARAVESTKDFMQFEEVVDNIHWVIRQLTHAHSSSSASDKPRPPVSASWTHTFSRGNGKRTVKPSQRVRDLM